MPRKALQLLHTGDYSVREVADSVGYSYSKNFTTALKRRYGVSPVRGFGVRLRLLRAIFGGDT